ncbi:MAG TPA: hypothetical protein VL337_02050 [Acidimicrobiales bacterium]|nr:hypothetical protein [Acidimicrobiales bacterium]
MGPFILLNLLLLNEPMLLHLHEDASPPVIGDSAEPDGLVHDFDVVDLQSLVRLGRPKGIQP